MLPRKSPGLRSGCRSEEIVEQAADDRLAVLRQDGVTGRTLAGGRGDEVLVALLKLMRPALTMADFLLHLKAEGEPSSWS